MATDERFDRESECSWETVCHWYTSEGRLVSTVVLPLNFEVLRVMDDGVIGVSSGRESEDLSWRFLPKDSRKLVRMRQEETLEKLKGTMKPDRYRSDSSDGEYTAVFSLPKKGLHITIRKNTSGEKTGVAVRANPFLDDRLFWSRKEPRLAFFAIGIHWDPWARPPYTEDGVHLFLVEVSK